MTHFLFIVISIFAIQVKADTAYIEKVKKEYQDALKRDYSLLPHKGNYLIPFSYVDNPNQEYYQALTSLSQFQGRGDYYKNLEAEFQISFLIPVIDDVFNTKFNLNVAYTHNSWWQVYNDKWSKQFRETNYTPEIFGRKVFNNPKRIFGGYFIGYDLGFVHQSNGQIQELSRSWDRLFTRFIFNHGKVLISASLWWRLPEDDQGDQNPDIVDFMGHGEIQGVYQDGKSEYRLKIIPGLKKQGIEASYNYPWRRGLRFFLKVNAGYGSSLIEHDTNVTRIGFGISISDILTDTSRKQAEKNELIDNSIN